MSYSRKETAEIENVQIKNFLPEIGLETMREEIISGLLSEQKWISSKYFYDEKGSKLFENITRLEEYYPTRTEKKILQQLAPGLMKTIANTDIIELGSGDHTKINILLEQIAKPNIDTIHYIPVDVSLSAIEGAAQVLNKLYSDLHIEGYVADFMNQLKLLPNDRKRLFCFFGSTIGNLEQNEAELMMKKLGNSMNPGDRLLLGLDLVKPEPVLNAAYNDSQGITASFNKNILTAVNRIVQTNFSEDDFNHVAFYNKHAARIEMHLEARKDIIAYSKVFDTAIRLNKNERIHTENSHKYTEENINEFAQKAGLKKSTVFSDDKAWFAVVELVK